MDYRAINKEEYVDINGISQYLYHLGTKLENPVMLFLHGGPGSPESLLCHTFQEKWEEIYTVVHWDQREAGKTLSKNPGKNKLLTIDLLLQDLYEIVQYLKRLYKKDKIVLLGHSWGSVLGSLYIQKYPEDISYYIGVGQVVNFIENEKVGYEKLKELIIKNNNLKDKKKLEKIGQYPLKELNKQWLKKCMKVRKLQSKYDLSMKMDLSLYIKALKSPIFKLTDIISNMKGLKANENIFKFLGDFNLNDKSAVYKIPIYYIMGRKDWQTPYIIAEKYFTKISAPYKKFYFIPDAGHMTMMDNPNIFFKTLNEIFLREKNLLKL